MRVKETESQLYILPYDPEAVDQEVPLEYKRTEAGVIPEDWNSKNLGNLFTFKNGLNKAKRFFGVGTPIVNYMDVFKHPGLRNDQVEGRVSLTTEEIKNFEVRKGDVFFTRTSETLNEVGIASVMLDDPSDTVFSGFVLRARPTDKRLNDEYKQYCFSTRDVRQQIVSTGTYTTRALTNGRSLSAVYIPLPPLTEQRAIASALSDVDALLDGLDRLIAKKRNLKQAAMQQLLTGQTRLPGFHEQWQIGQLEDAAATDPENLDSNTRSDFPFKYIALEDVERGVLQSHSEHVLASAPSRARRKLRPNDILVATVRPNLQSHLLFRSCGGDWVCSTGFCVVRCRDAIAHPYFVFSQMFADGVIKQIDALLTGSNYPAINGGDVRSLMIPIPSFEEQAAIASVLSDMDAEIAALEARRDKTRDLKQAMMQELLTGRTRLVTPEVAHA